MIIGVAYVVGMIITAALIRRSFLHAYNGGKYNEWKSIAIYITMVILWPLTLVFVLFVLWIGSMLPPTF